MFKRLLPSLSLALMWQVQLTGGEALNFCPQGLFSNDAGSIEFKVKPYTPDYTLRSIEGSLIDFSGPIFPGYKLAKPGKVDLNPETRTITAEQYCESAKADVTKTFTSLNGGLLSTISYKLKGEALKTPPQLRIFLPLSVYAGKSIARSGGKIDFPKDKTANYTLYVGTSADEFRFPVSNDMEIGLKLISGFSRYQFADCRHHGKPEECFHISVTMSGESLSYFLCLLKPGEPFPSTTQEEKKAEPKEVSGNRPAVNLLGAGSGFEIGPHGLRPFAAYSWDEAWVSSAAQPEFDPQVAYQGKYSLKLTAEDIKGKNGRFNFNQVWFAPVKLDAAKTYTFSAWMKSDLDGTMALMSVSEPWLNELQNPVPVSKEWKKYSFTFKPEKFKLLNFRRCAIAIGGSKGKLWIDNVQLEEGSGGNPVSEPLEVGASIDRPNKLFTSEELEHAEIKLLFRNNTDRELECTIPYVIKDYWDKVVKTGSITQKIAANSNSQEQIKLPALHCGYYRVSFDNSGKYHDEVIFGVYEPMKELGQLPQNWPLGCHNSEGNPLTRKLGFGWTRGWEFSFKKICPEPGKLDFTLTDIIVERCRKTGINLMPIIGPDFARRSYDKDGNNCIPAWAIEKTVKSSVKGSQVLDVSFPRIDAWKTYVKALVSHYKKDIKVWEVMNEPNCWLTPEEYAPYLKATYEAAKAADPDCVIVGVCATSDWGGEPAPWTNRVIELDKGQSMDVLSIHMYSNTAPEEYKNIGSDGMLLHLKKELLKYGKNIPVWHTEKSHNTTAMGYSDKKLKLPPLYLREPGFRVPDFRAKTEYLIRETLIDSSVGNGPFFWFGKLSNDIYIMSQNNEYGLGHTEFDGSPCPEIIAANGLARMLEGRSNPKGMFKLDISKYAALYEGKQGTMVALWDISGTSSIKLPAGLDKFTIWNMFGATMPVPADRILELGKAPVYLLFATPDASKIKAMLLQSEVKGKTLTFSGGLELENGTPVLAVYAFNRTVKNLNARLTVSTDARELTLKNRESNLSCFPEQYNRAVFPVSLPAKTTSPVQFQVSDGNQSATVAIPPIESVEQLKEVLSDSRESTALQVKTGEITIDGSLAEWSDAGTSGAATANKVKVGRALWQSPLDLSCSMRFRWDADNLYVGAMVYDNVMERNAEAANAYNSDSIELFIGLDTASSERAAKAKEVHRTGPLDYQILLAPGMASGQFNQPTAWNCQLKNNTGIKIAAKIFALGYTLEAAIPWKTLKKDYQPAKDNQLLICFQAADADVAGQPARKTIFWTGDESNWMSPQNWGRMTLR